MVEDGMKQYESFVEIEKMAKSLDREGFVEINWVTAEEVSPGEE